MKRILRGFTQYTILFCGLIALFTLLMTAVYALPKDRIARNASAAIDTLDVEADHAVSPFHVSASAMDYYTDRLMLDTNILDEPESSALHNALHINNYSRYWHGYQVFLRPMLLLGGLELIRYCNMFLMYLLLALLFSAIQRRVHLKGAIAALHALLTAYVWTATISLQFFYPMALTLSAMLFTVRWYQPDRPGAARLAFFAIGMLTSFIDLLTAPLSTLGMPLACAALIHLKEERAYSLKKALLNILWLSVAWCAGYLLCWAAKAVLGTLALGENVGEYFLSQIVFRSGMEERMSLFTRFSVVKENLQQYRFRFLGSWREILLAVAAVYGLLLVFLRKANVRVKNLIPLLLIACYPAAWYFTIGNHSTVHSWYTCHSLMITTFCMLSAMLETLDFRKLGTPHLSEHAKIG